MSSDLEANWHWIAKLFQKSLLTTRFYTFATVNPDGSAHVAPYASLVLNDDCTGYYSDVFPNQMTRNLKTDQRISILAVNFSFFYWLKGLFCGRFDNWPAVRLYGTVGRRRKAAPGEIDRWRKRLKPYKCFKGYDLLWKDIESVRDIRFTHFEPVHLGPMTRQLRSD